MTIIERHRNGICIERILVDKCYKRNKRTGKMRVFQGHRVFMCDRDNRCEPVNFTPNNFRDTFKLIE
jgi:hypothetical protein